MLLPSTPGLGMNGLGEALPPTPQREPSPTPELSERRNPGQQCRVGKAIPTKRCRSCRLAKKARNAAITAADGVMHQS
ncbi:hypothetical protein SERLADRAFT_437434 [Serpula lacrymans var. lacrymans S7.9]|uniref:Uncharacterized protein n=1 Tax=Serpula lacrymans var. lacrymans (strain S7.9) TaxID=578457 RepID=F8NTN9_SERL9|nr:uncharacterized protein SERLADRAFT_437434 [Serpula lacrymans var. lacrymans S7.9]EGO25710.1 hypothetical protein SERLADRAFT_437434 [Serpula lacrymans var. lacrymans S7.9]